MILWQVSNRRGRVFMVQADAIEEAIEAARPLFAANWIVGPDYEAVPDPAFVFEGVRAIPVTSAGDGEPRRYAAARASLVESLRRACEDDLSSPAERLLQANVGDVGGVVGALVAVRVDGGPPGRGCAVRRLLSGVVRVGAHETVLSLREDTGGQVSSVWIVSGAEYDNHGPVAAFTTKELAEAYAALNKLDVDEFTVHNRVPNLVTLHLQSATVLPDGTVQRSGCHSQEFWDSEVPDPILLVRGSQGTQVIAWQEDRAAAERACLEEVKALLGEIAERGQYPAEWLPDAIESARQVITPPAYVAPKPVCYAAQFGMVHVSPGCRCAGRRR